MSEVSIQRTTLSPGRLDLLLANSPERESASLWIDLAVALDTVSQANAARPLAIVQARALLAAQRTISAQIEVLRSLLNQNPSVLLLEDHDVMVGQ